MMLIGKILASMLIILAPLKKVEKAEVFIVALDTITFISFHFVIIYLRRTRMKYMLSLL